MRAAGQSEERFLDDLPGSTNRRPGSLTLRPGASRKRKGAGLSAPFQRQGRRKAGTPLIEADGSARSQVCLQGTIYRAPTNAKKELA